MTQQALVSYFHYAAFTVSLRKTLLIFSYRQTGIAELADEELRLSERDFSGFNNILVFVPTASATHFDKAIFDWKQSFPLTYILPPEAAKQAPRAANVRVCREGDHFTVGHSEVEVYSSTDAGVSFLVRAEGLTTYHAGDLNLWHWREENTLREIARAEETFYQKVAALPKNQIDLAFFPLAPNQGGFYDAGANHFIMATRPRVFFPTHYGNRVEIANEYARRAFSRRTTVFALSAVRESALVDLSGAQVQVRSSQVRNHQRPHSKPGIELAAYTHEDPFAQTDLPVNIQEEKPQPK